MNSLPVTFSSLFAQIPSELKDINFTNSELDLFYTYYYDAGLLSNSKLYFFEQHYTFNLDHIFSNFNFNSESTDPPIFLDLGCGLGTQSIYMALKGFKVYALDLDQPSLDVFSKRIDYYQNIYNIFLDITIVNDDAFTFLQKTNISFDYIWSLFAFNMMQPTSKLLPLLNNVLKPSGLITIMDGNPSSFVSLLPSRRRPLVSSISSLSSAFSSLGYSISLEPTLLIPIYSSSLIKYPLSFLNFILKPFRFFWISYCIIARKN